jgi:hypothetical protein
MVTMPVASNHRGAKELVAEMCFDPVDFGPPRMAQVIEDLQIMWLIPVVQQRQTGWEIHFRRSNPPCHWGSTEEWALFVYDAKDLADIPQTREIPESCP